MYIITDENWSERHLRAMQRVRLWSWKTSFSHSIIKRTRRQLFPTKCDEFPWMENKNGELNVQSCDSIAFARETQISLDIQCVEEVREDQMISERYIRQTRSRGPSGVCQVGGPSEVEVWILREGGFPPPSPPPPPPPLPPLVNGTEYKVVACSTLGHSTAETSRLTEKKNSASLWEFSFAGSSLGSPLSVLRGRKGTTGSTDSRDEVQIRSWIRARLPSARSLRVRRGIIKLCLRLRIFLRWITGKSNFNTDVIR